MFLGRKSTVSSARRGSLVEERRVDISISGEGVSGRDVHRRRRNLREVTLDVFNLIYPEQCTLKFNARIMHLGILLKCRF